MSCKKIFRFRFVEYALCLLGSLAVFHGEASGELVDGTLYGLSVTSGPLSRTELLSIDPTDASWTIVTTLSGVEMESFEIASDGTIFATGAYDASTGSVDNTLYSIDADAGTYTTIGSLGGNYYFTGLAMAADGTLYGSEVINNQLFTIDTSTGFATLVGDITGPTNIAGLSFDAEGTLYGVSFDEGLYSIDTATAAATAIGGTTDRLLSLAIDPDSDEMLSSINSASSGIETLASVSSADGSTTVIGTMNVGTLDAISFYSAAAVPEPSMLLVVAPLVGCVFWRRRK